MTVNAHFDGRVFVPDGPVDLPVGHRVRVVPEPAAAPELDGASPEVRDFCAAHGLFGPVAQLRQLAREHMSGLTGTELWVQADPETGESWLVVEARLGAASSTVLAEYNALLRRWIEMTEPRTRDLMRFTFTLP
jgi:hypothetical protein